MVVQRYNYPKHPLFGIAPLLDKGFQTVLHDEYTSRLVGRIRAGRYAPDLWDCNSLYLGYSERIAAVRAARIAIKSRYEMTPQERKDWRERYDQAPDVIEARARRKQAAAERKAARQAWEENFARQASEAAAERQRVEEEAERLKAARAAARERQDREWAERAAELAAEKADRAAAWMAERDAVLAGSWECARCQRPSIIMPVHGRYQLTCPRCARTATVEHAALIALVNARNIRGFPLNPG